MFYVKNLPRWERALRLLLGVGGVTAALVLASGWAMGLGVAAGTCLTLSGVVGFCPACALYGRRLGPARRG